ncbi:MAG: hypothetical protein COB36_08870 [Alphaproteobacteria bacterium]|nr:MAG: hypothetical protein COB36_08870 [Alphaproteobacteria bacterium]
MHYIYSADNAAEAHMIMHMLEREGIETQIHGEYLQGAVGEIPVTGHIKLSVTESNVTKARESIKKWESIQQNHPANKDEGKHKKSNRPTLFSGIAIGLTIGLILGIFYYHVPFSSKGYDNNGDGILDMHFYPPYGDVKRTETDTNFDGKIDIKEFYDRNGLIKKAEIDADYNGYYETIITYKNGNPLEQTIDDNGDNFPDRIFLYDQGGNLKTLQVFNEQTARLVKITYYNNDRMISAQFDSNQDGIMDTEYTYDKYEEISSTKSLLKNKDK